MHGFVLNKQNAAGWYRTANNLALWDFEKVFRTAVKCQDAVLVAADNHLQASVLRIRIDEWEPKVDHECVLDIVGQKSDVLVPWNDRRAIRQFRT